MWLCLQTQRRSRLESSQRTLRQTPCTVRPGSDLAKPPRFSEHQFPAEREASHPPPYPREAFLPGTHTLSAPWRSVKLREVTVMNCSFMQAFPKYQLQDGYFTQTEHSSCPRCVCVGGRGALPPLCQNEVVCINSLGKYKFLQGRGMP